jgi:UDP-N-acetylglucosamine 1-carboxyvinyltransferase
MDNSRFNGKQSLQVRGGQPTRGRVRVSGAKNAALPLLAASTLTDERVTLRNFPTELLDVGCQSELMNKIGVGIKFDRINETAEVQAGNIKDDLLKDYTYPIRTTYLLAAAQLNRNGRARIPYPGGCNIGDRKYNLHVMIWEQMGCEVKETGDFIEIKGRLKPAEIAFPFSTIGGTENALICAAGIRGRTTITNAYISPEVYCLIELLRGMGAEVQTAGNSFVSVRGNPGLRGTAFRVIPDRIEALTWIIFGILSGGEIIVKDVPFEIMPSEFIHLQESGIDLYANANNVFIPENRAVNRSIQPFELACGKYPGVISDMQPFFTLLGLKARGVSRIYDYRYPERTAYLAEIAKFCPGALEWQTGRIKITGPAAFRAADAVSTDLRGSMGMVLAALLADGVSTVSDVGMALRGYNKLLDKLKALGIECELKNSTGGRSGS